MRQKLSYLSVLIASSLLLAGVSSGAAQTVQGEASAVEATIPAGSSLLGGSSLLSGATNLLGGSSSGTTTTLASTGPLSAANDVLDASQVTGSVPSLLTADTLSAATISWPDEVDSEASLANLNLTVAGIPIRADLVMAEASQSLGTAGSGESFISGLSINGVAVPVSGYPNQTVAIPGGQVIINEQTISSTGATVVNALHIIVTGVADVTLASATAGIS
jgi:hypothetical protein